MIEFMANVANSLNIGLAIILLAVITFSAFLTRFAHCPENIRSRWRQALEALQVTKQRFLQERRNLKVARRQRGVTAPGEEWLAAMDAVSAQRTAVRDATARAREIGEQLGNDVQQRKNRERQALDNSIKAHNEAIQEAARNLRAHRREARESLWDFLFDYRYWPLVATLFIVFGDLVYYRLFGFNVLQYYWDSPTASLLTVVLTVPVFLAFYLLFIPIYMVLFTLLATLLLAVRIVGWIRRSLFTASKLALWLYCAACRSIWYIQLAFYLTSKRRSTEDAGGLLAKGFHLLHVAKTRVYTRLASVGGSPLLYLEGTLAVSVVGLFMVFFEPAFRAHAVCENPGSARVVVDPRFGERPVDYMKIGSLGNHMFLTADSSCGEDQSRDVDDVAKKPEVDGEGLRGVPLDMLSRVANVTCDAIVRRWHFFHSMEAWPRRDGVVVVPFSRVLCMHDDTGRDGDSISCKVPEETEVVDPFEELLRAQIKEAVPCKDGAAISAPIVFAPNEWKETVNDDVARVKIAKFVKNPAGTR